MAKITIEINKIREGLEQIGYVISDFEERENNGLNWQFKFSNSGSCVTIYDSNNKKNSVVNGKCEEGEKEALKNIVDELKCNELTIDGINKQIVDLINAKKEDYYYDFKAEWYKTDKESKADFIHDILCLANNIENQNAFLIIGVEDQNYQAIGVEQWKKSNEIFDFLREIKFAGGKTPEIELKKIYYKYKKIDVLMIKASNEVPFFLLEKYNGVFDYNIYTRVGDTNTPKNKNASYSDIEKLWGFHFNKAEGTN